jgi:hypothetical protein
MWLGMQSHVKASCNQYLDKWYSTDYSEVLSLCLIKHYTMKTYGERMYDIYYY